MPSTPEALAEAQIVQPRDIAAGLGAAERSLLALCLALFDDGALAARLSQIATDAQRWARKRLNRPQAEEVAESVESRMGDWQHSGLSDDALRVALWVYLRDALSLEPRTTRSERGLGHLVEEVAAAAVTVADPPGQVRRVRDWFDRQRGKEANTPVTTLSDVVRPVLAELVASSLGEADTALDTASQQQLIAEAKGRIAALGTAERQAMVEAVGATELNDAAVRNILITGGGLGAFSASVGASGFGAYILAAQASAFVPLVSGPGLVSLVAVVANPITVLALTSAGAWWFSSSASQKVRTAVALRVIALLALRGLSASRGDGAALLKGFSELPELAPPGEVDARVWRHYQDDWRRLQDVTPRTFTPVNPEVADYLDRTGALSESPDARWRRLLFPGEGGSDQARLTATLTLGDLAYHGAAIEPEVIRAADFSRAAEIEGRLDFAALAGQITSLAPAAASGAGANLKGYVAERVVAAQLVAQGHQVTLPEHSNQAGWDLKVDGETFQVKCLEDLHGLDGHFERYPDIPVLANAELAPALEASGHGWSDKVYFVEGYQGDLVSQVTEDSVEAGEALLNSDVPLFGVVVAGLLQGQRYREGRVTGVQAVQQVVMDGGVRAGLGLVGGVVGKGIGLVVLGPAGGLVLGSVVPILAQAQSRRILRGVDWPLKTRRQQEWEEHTQQTLDGLGEALQQAIQDKLGILEAKHASLGEGLLAAYVGNRLLDDALHLHESRVRIADVMEAGDLTMENRALSLIALAARSTVHPRRYQQPLRELHEALADRPALWEALR